MIILSVVDYVIICIICLAVILRIVGDIRDILAAKFIKNTVQSIVRQNFSPNLTIIIPFEQLNDTKQTLEHLNKTELPISLVVAIDKNRHTKSAGALRYFIKKYAIHAKVTERKYPNLTGIAREYAKADLVVILPDTVRLNESFYDDAILPFGEKTVNTLQLIPSVRVNKTVASGIEVLFVAWRRYLKLNGIRRSNPVSAGALTEGMVVRAELLRQLSKEALNPTEPRRAAYSVAAQGSFKGVWCKLQESAGVLEYGAVSVGVSIILLLAKSPNNLLLTTGVFALLYLVFVWWSLETARISLADRISIVFLSPFCFFIAVSLIVARIVRYSTLLRKSLKRSLYRVYSSRDRIASNRS